jgi:hypothetical protein
LGRGVLLLPFLPAIPSHQKPKVNAGFTSGH